MTNFQESLLLFAALKKIIFILSTVFFIYTVYKYKIYYYNICYNGVIVHIYKRFVKNIVKGRLLMSKKTKKAAAMLAAGSLLCSALGMYGTASASAAEDDVSYILHDTFESGSDDWSGRGSASAERSDSSPFKGEGCLLVGSRASSWNGAQKELGSIVSAGKEYSFSVCVQAMSGKPQMMLSLQYNTADGKTEYGHIAQGKAEAGSYLQLAETNYAIPEGASDFVLYVETESGTDSFCVDEVVIAEAGTVIKEKAPGKMILGDINGDGIINSFDVAAARSGLVSGFTDKNQKKAADVDRDTEFAMADVVLISEFVHGKINEFPDNSPEVPSVSGGTYTKEELLDHINSTLVNNEPMDSRTEKPGVDYGTIKKSKYFSKKANKEKPYNILLPANYDPNKKYPVLYLLHGFFENEDRMMTQPNMYTRQIIGNAIAEGEAKEMIVVVPFIFTSSTLDNAKDFGDAASNEGYENFVDDIVDSLMPHIEENYSVATGRENTAVTGFSMGGRESLQIGMKYPDKFGYVGAICPAPGVVGSFKWSSPEEEPYFLMITGGDNDNVVTPFPSNYHDNFTKNGVPHVWQYIKGGAHGDNSIHPAVYNFVRAIFQVAT